MGVASSSCNRYYPHILLSGDVAGQTTTCRSLHMPLLLNALYCKRFACFETILPFFEASRHILPYPFYPAYSEINHPISSLYFCHTVFPWRIKDDLITSLQLLSGAFEKLRETTVSFVVCMPVRPSLFLSICPHGKNVAPNAMILWKFDIGECFEDLSIAFRFH